MGKSTDATTRERQHGTAGERWASSHTVRTGGTRIRSKREVPLRRTGVSQIRSLPTPTAQKGETAAAPYQQGKSRGPSGPPDDGGGSARPGAVAEAGTGK